MLPCAEGAPERDDTGLAYTLGNDGAVTDVGLDPPVSVKDVSGDSGRERRDVSVMRCSDIVRSRDCARFVRERGFERWSFSFASSSESDPRLSASSLWRVLTGTPVPLKWSQTTFLFCRKFAALTIGGSGVQ